MIRQTSASHPSRRLMVSSLVSDPSSCGSSVSSPSSLLACPLALLCQPRCDARSARSSIVILSSLRATTRSAQRSVHTVVGRSVIRIEADELTSPSPQCIRVSLELDSTEKRTCPICATKITSEKDLRANGALEDIVDRYNQTR